MFEEVFHMTGTVKKRGGSGGNAAVSESQMDHLRRLADDGATLVKVFVFGHDSVSVGLSVFPDVDIAVISHSEMVDMDDLSEVAFEFSDQFRG